MAKTFGKDKVDMPDAKQFGREDKSLSTLNNNLPAGHKFKEFSLDERLEFNIKYGWDPIKPEPPTEFVVFGDNEDTYIKLSFGAPIQIKDERLRRKFETVLKTTFDALCQMATFGPMNTAATLDKLQGPDSGRNSLPEGY